MGKPSLNYQLFTVLENALAIGESKRNYREIYGNHKTDKIFSYSCYDSIKQTSMSFSKFINENYPEIRQLKEIMPCHISDYLEIKSKTCNDNTLLKLKMHIESIGIFASKKYKSVNVNNWKVVNSPCSNLPNNIRFKNGFTEPEIIKLEQYASAPRRENMQKALMLVKITGLRLDEVWTQRVSDFHILSTDKGDFGYGYINVSDAKHGRNRCVSIISADDRKVLMRIIQNSKNDKIITCSKTNLQRMLAQAKKATGLESVGQSWHAIRKFYAQRFYDFYRSKHTRKETINATNHMLGHGRGQLSKLETYVENIW